MNFTKSSLLKITVILYLLLSNIECGENATEPRIVQWPTGKIVFDSDRTGNKQLYTMNVDGSEITRLTFNNYEDSSPKWSPDGKNILFTRFKDSVYKSFIMDADGLNDKPVSDSTYNELNPSWFPSGKKIIFQKIFVRRIYVGTDRHDYNTSKICSMDIDGKNEKVIETNFNFSFPGPGITLGDFYPCVSPDEEKITFTHFYYPHYGIYDIYSCNIDGTNVFNITNYNIDAGPLFRNPTYSPDGSKILFCASYNASQAPCFSIYVMNTNGSNEKGVGDIHCSENPRWSSDGKFIIFDSNRDGNRQIYIMDSTGTQTKRISNNSFNDIEPDILLIK